MAFYHHKGVVWDDPLISAVVFAKWGKLSQRRSRAIGSVAPPVMAIDTFNLLSSLNKKSVNAAVISGPSIPLIIISRAKKAVICPLSPE